MTTYEVIDPLTGSRWQGGLEDLSRNLKVNALLCSVSEDGAQTSLGIILHRDIVLFALQWAKSIVKPTAEVLKCLELTEKWLEDEDGVTKEELRNAAYAVDAARGEFGASYAYAASYADVAATDADAAWVDATAWVDAAAWAAVAASRAAAYAADADPRRGAAASYAASRADAAHAASYAASHAAASYAASHAAADATQGKMIVDYYASSCAK